MASISSGEAFFIDGVYYALSKGVLKRNWKLTSNHLWPRVQYSVFSETLPYKMWFYTKKVRHKYVWPTHHFYDKMYCYEPRQRLGPYRWHHSPLHLSSQKKKLAVLKTLLFHFICVVVKIKIFEVFPLSCNDNNYMTYSWPNSAFFNFQEYAKQENSRQYSCIAIFFPRNWN